jgi:hypothetical protein
MADIRFETDYNTSSQTRQQKNPRMTQFFIDKSFGLISTPAQASAVQLVLAVALFMLAGYMFSKSGDITVPTKTPQDLINAPQPTRPLN